MTRHNTLWITFFLSICCLLALTGCDASKPDTPTESTAETQAPGTQPSGIESEVVPDSETETTSLPIDTETSNDSGSETEHESESETETEAHRHTYASEWTFDETHHWHKATCEHTDEIEGKTAHTLGEHEIVTAPTCSAEGEARVTCADCGCVLTITLPRVEHPFDYNTWTSDETSHWHAATCEHTGEIENKADHTYGEWEVITVPTCGAAGEKRRACTVCRYTQTEPLDVLSHTFSDVWSTDATHHWHAATCEHTDEIADKSSHTFGEWRITQASTCGGEGVEERACTECNYTESRSIAVLSHTYSDTWSTDATHHWHAATCEHTDEVKDKSTHTFGEWITTVEPTCGAEGTEERTCSTCSYTESRPIAKIAHTYSDEWSHDTNHHWHAATCEHTDEQADYGAHDYNSNYACRVCSYQHEHTYVETWTTDAAYHWHASACGHDGFIDGKAVHTFDDNYCCTGCGYQATPTEGLTYTLSADGASYLVSDIGTATDTVLVIPSTYNGLPVTGVDMVAFYMCESLTNVFLPSTMTYIGENAFDGCTALQSINIPANVTELKSKAFHRCTSLAYVDISNGLTSIGEYAFYYCYNLTSIAIPDSVTSIGNYAFEGCRNLKSITIGNGVTSIGYSTFRGCSSLTSITIPDSVTSIGSDAFYDCSSLTDITIPDSVTSIGYSTFRGCSSLTSITIPDSVTSIGSDAFYDCSSLTDITIPDSVTSIGSDAFDYCYSLTSITIPDSITNINIEMFSGCNNLIQKDRGVSYIDKWIVDCENLPKVTLRSDTVGIAPYAFAGCSSLTSITIPDSVTSIGYYPFSGCSIKTASIPAIACSYIKSSALEKVIITSGTSIGNSAFSGCSNLTSITIPDSVTSIGQDAFSGCSGLTSISVAEGNTVYHATGNCLIETTSKTLIVGCQTSVIPSDGSVTSIGSYAFKGCRGLASITIPDSVTSIGSSAFFGCSGLTSITIPFVGATKAGSDNTHFGYIFGASKYYDNDDYVPVSLKTVVITGGTSIGQDAFSDCSSLTSITIPDSVTSIGFFAFEDCSSLTSISVAEGNPVYHAAGNCLIETTSKTLIVGCQTSVIPSDGSVTSIGESAFSGCSSLTNITIPDSVTSIGGYAFSGCSNLTSITIPDSVTSIGSYAFSGCQIKTATIPAIACSYIRSSVLEEVTITSGTSIDSYAFSDCSGLTSITIPDSVTSIGFFAFEDCSNLTSITIPDSVTSIGESAFEGCSNLTSITIPDSVTSIDSYAFFGCSNLTSITIPDSVTSIGNSAFSGCSSLTSITIPDSVTSIGYSTFRGCSSLTSITIPFVGGAKTGSNRHFGYIFGASKYYDNDDYVPVSLKTVVITGGTSIDYHAFYGCSSLTSITIPDSVTSIDSYAFEGCSSLTNITIGNGVTSIGSYAFSGCSGLTSINFEGTKAQWSSIFKGNGWNGNTGTYTIYCTDGGY